MANTSVYYNDPMMDEVLQHIGLPKDLPIRSVEIHQAIDDVPYAIVEILILPKARVCEPGPPAAVAMKRAADSMRKLTRKLSEARLDHKTWDDTPGDWMDETNHV